MFDSSVLLFRHSKPEPSDENAYLAFNIKSTAGEQSKAARCNETQHAFSAPSIL